MLRQAVLGGLASALLFAPPAGPIGSADDRNPPPAGDTATADVGPKGLEANVTSTSQIGGTVPFQRVKRVPVPVMCWMSKGPTGAQYAQDWGEGGKFWRPTTAGAATPTSAPSTPTS